MTGGLLQLATTGIQDSPLILNPEITFFKKVYKQYTNFSLCQNDRYLGLMNFDKVSSKIIEKNGDLLYNLYFKIDIPYFDIIKTTVNTTITEQKYDINSLDVTYINSNCILLYSTSSNIWYIVPEKLFSLSYFDNYLIKIDENELQPKLLPDYISVIDLSPELYLYQIKDDKTNSLISLIRMNSNFFEQYWLELINNSSDVDMLNKLVTLKNELALIYKLIKNRIYNLYWNKNYNQVGEYTYGYNKKNLEYFNFSFASDKDNNGQLTYKSETERYFEYLNSYEYVINNFSSITNYYDIDITYKYCLDNFLTFNDYRDQVLQKNSIVLLIILNMLYGESDLIYTFWKKYDTSENNAIRLDVNVSNTNFNNEWNVNINNYLLGYFSTTEIKNYIYDIFKKKYFAVEQQINNIFNNLSLLEPTKIYVKLKTILSRFYKIPYKQINFNNFSLSTYYPDTTVSTKYNNDNFEYLNIYETDKYPTLKKIYDDLDTTNEMNNLTPVDLQNIYNIFSNDLLNLITENLVLSRGLISPIVLWRNSITNRLYRIFLDTYTKTISNGDLIDFKNTRRLTFYHTIQPSNLFFYQDFINSFYEIFYKNSWLGSYSINGNLFLNFKQNIFETTINNLFDDNNTFQNDDNKFHTLTINNIYTFTYYDNIETFDNYNKYNYKSVIYDNTNKKLYVKYDNFYNKNSTIVLYVNDNIINYNNINYEIVVLKGVNNILFNSYYLSFDNVSSIVNKDIIKLDVTYSTNLPLVLFYKDTIDYPSLPINKFYLITKNSNNSIKLNNINNNLVQIDQTFISNKIKLLNINYLVNNIVPPENNNITVENIESDQNNYVNKGGNVYYYCISYLIGDVESEVSNPFNTTLTDDTKYYYIKLDNLPISENKYITSRNIYRTKGNGNDYYLLVNISNNVDVSFIDNITDDILGIYYDNNGIVKYKLLPQLKNNNNSIKIPITLNQVDNYYEIRDITDTVYNLPTEYDNIREIYIESLDFTYDLIEDYTINNNGQINLTSEDYSTNNLYYLVDSINYKENVKLVSSKDNIPISPLSITELTSGSLSGVYKYKVSFYNNLTGIESLPSTQTTTNSLTSKKIKLDDFPVIYDKVQSQGGGYNGWKIYRTKANSNTYYYLDTLLETINNIYIDNIVDSSLTIELSEPYLSITRPINLQNITKPGVVGLFNLNTSGNVNLGTHKYVITYLGSSEETIQSTENSIFLATNTQVRLSLPISSDEKVIGRKIYRTTSNNTDYKLLEYISNNTDTIYIDNISDNDLYIQPYSVISLLDITRLERITVEALDPVKFASPTSNLKGIYYYIIVYVHLSYGEEKYIYTVVPKNILLNTFSYVTLTFGLSQEPRHVRKEIYRKSPDNPSDANYRLVTIINNNTDTTYVDDLSYNSIKNNKILNYTNFIPNNVAGTYKYVLTNISEFEVEQSNMLSITLSGTSEIIISLPTITNSRINNIKIYRTSVNDSEYKYLTNLVYSTTVYYDNTSDSNLSSIISDELITVTPPLYNASSKPYYVLKIPRESFVPNLNDYISFSSDPYFANNKNISDLNDYLVNKSFLMMVKGNNNSFNNNKNLLINNFDSSYLYFYNIGFKIDSSSTITLNDKSVNYLLPLSSQQFFINNDTFYKYIGNERIEASTYEVLQNSFNPAFDEFNLTNTFIKNNYYFDIFIDSVLDKINDIISINPDYKTIIDLIDTSNNKYINIFVELLNNSNFGLTSQKILENTTLVNKFNNIIMTSDPTKVSINLDIINYNNFNYYKYSHDSLRLVEQDNLKSDKDLVRFDTSITSLSVLSPIYQYYNSNKKISSNLTDYLINVKDYFNSHINYVNNNIDYLNISNPNNYIEKYISYEEIKQEINNNFYDYNDVSIINTLHPIIGQNPSNISSVNEQNYYKITLNDTVLENVVIDKPNNNITCSNDLNVILENNYYDSKILQENRNTMNNEKLNYLGLLYIDDSSKMKFNDVYTNPPVTSTYFRLDDNSIYNAIYKFDFGGRYYINTQKPDLLVSNPYELSFVKKNNNVITLTKLSSDKYIQIILIKFLDLFNNNLGLTNFLINNKVYEGYYQSTGNYTGYLYLIVDEQVIINDNYLIYQSIQNDYTSWEISSKVIDYDIVKFKKVNYYINSILTISEGDVYSYNDNYYDIFNTETVNVLNKTYFYIDSTLSTIDIVYYKKILPTDAIPSTNYVLYVKVPGFFISNNYIYYYYYNYDYSISLLENNPEYYILLINLINNRYFILKIKDITTKQIPNDNYYCWIFPKEYLKLVKYNINFNIDSLGNIQGLSSLTNQPIIVENGIYLPTYSFYMVKYQNEECCYYYKDGTSISISDNNINYYDNFKNINLTEIYLISDEIINKINNQLLKLSKSVLLTENYITKLLSSSSNNLSFDNNELNNLIYNSEYNKNTYALLNYNTSNIQLSGENEEVISLIIKCGSFNFYRPVVIRKYETNTIYNIRYIYGTETPITYDKSLVPISTSGYTSSILSNNLLIGSLVNTSNTYHSLSPNLIIDNFNVYIKKDFVIDDLDYSLYSWEIYVNNSYKIYFWTLFTTNTDLIDCHNNFVGFNEPVYDTEGIINIGSYDLVSSSPNIIKQVVDGTKNLVLDLLEKERIINYNYYIDTRYNSDNLLFEVKELKNNSLLNIRPNVELWLSSLTDLSQLDTNLLSKIIYLILVYKENNEKKINIFLKSEIVSSITDNEIIYNTGEGTFYDLVTKSELEGLSLYYSISYPQYVNNNINISNVNNINISNVYGKYYDITHYDNLYLEMGEIILIDNNYFYVHGLNSTTEHYRIELINNDTINNMLSYKYNGYYSFGNYLAKDNRIIPTFNYQNLLIYNKTYTTRVGDIYFDNNNKLIIATSIENVSNVNIFSEGHLPQNNNTLYTPNIIPLTIKLFYNKGNLYLFDNFIKLKIMDKIIYDSAIYEIRTIRDNQIFLDKTIVIANNNIFIECILPYQPFEIKYVYISNDGSLNNNIFNYNTILLNNNDDLIMYNVIDGKISLTDSSFIGGYYYVRVFNTNYYSNFENKMFFGTSPENITDIYTDITNSNYNINNKFPIEIPTVFTNNKFKLLNDKILFDYFNFYYMQPVSVGGTFNYLLRIINDAQEGHNNYYFELLNPVYISNSFENKLINILFSSSYCNLYEYYTQLKINFNFGLNVYDYNKLLGNKISVIRYALKNDELIFIQNENILFNYGKALVENEVDNNIDNINYENIYFYEEAFINSSGFFNNFDTVQSTYHLIVEELIDNTQGLRIQKVHLAKIIFPNKIKIYTDVDISNSVFYLDRVIPIKINSFGEFIYTNLSITQSRHLIEENKNVLNLVKRHEIRFIGLPILDINNNYKQQIEFINDDVLDYISHTIVYIDEDLTKSVNYIYDPIIQGYYISSNQYMLNDITFIYSNTINYVNTCSRNSTIKNNLFSDTSIKYDYIDNNYINEYYVHKIKITKLVDLDYKYELLDNSINFSIENIDNYRINIINQNIFKINNSNRIISLYDPIDNDIVEYTDTTSNINVFLINQLSNNLLLNSHRLFNNVKQLRTKLLDLSFVETKYIVNSIKPWSSWSLLNGINKVNSLTELVNNIHLQWNTVENKVNYITNNNNYSYLTNDEVSELSLFLELVETDNDAKNNYYNMKEIEELIFNNISDWLNNPQFFLNVIDNVNKLLYYNGYDVIFDGTSIIFNNGQKYGYITNEFVYDSVNKIVYRSNDNYNNINVEIENFINNNNNGYFGLNVNKLLNYLYRLGEELKILFNNFTNPVKNLSEYDNLNPLKFIIDKLWNKSEDLNSIKLYYELSTTNNIYSAITFNNDYNINYNGINSYNYYVPLNYDPTIELNIGNLSIYQPNIIKIVNIPDELIINPLYPCRITFEKETIQDATYYIDFLNGERIADDLNITNKIIYPDQINFYSEYNIKPTDEIIVKQSIDYSIEQSNIKFLGYKFGLNFDNNVMIDQIYFRNYNLTIQLIQDKYVEILIPFTFQELSYLNDIDINNPFQFKNYIGIKSTTILGDKQYLEFYNNNFNFNPNNTLLKTTGTKTIHKLYYDNKYYILDLNSLELNVEIITLIVPSLITSYNEALYEIDVGTDVISKLLPINNNYLIPLEFKLINSDNTLSISPTKINTFNTSLIFYFTINDNLKIIGSGRWYYFDFSLTETFINDSIVYLYDKSIVDIDIPNNIFIPMINTESKKSTDTFKLNNRVYIQTNIDYSNEIELDTNISYVIYNKWTITSFTYNTVNNYLTFNIPYNMPILSSVNEHLYYKIDNIVVDINITLNYNPTTKTIVIVYPNNINSTSFILEQWWIDTEDKITRIDNKEDIIWDKINQTRKLGNDLINKINGIEKQSQYIYTFPQVISRTENTIIYIYNKIDDIDINSGIYDPINNIETKTSNYISDKDGLTIFSITNKFTLTELLNYSFIQKNIWYINSFSIINNNLTFDIPSDFIYSTQDKYYYKINDAVIDKYNIIISNGKITINNFIIYTPFSFNQYYISSDSLLNIPDKNIVIKVTVDYPYQYDITNNKFYILPYTSAGNELDEYLYLLETDLVTTNSGFAGAGTDNNEIILYSNTGVKYVGKIFDKYYNQKVYYVISLKEKIDTIQSYSYSLSNDIINSSLSISYYQLSLQKCDYYLQNDFNTIYLFCNEEINNYLLSSTADETDNPTKFYLISYSNYKVENLYYDYTFTQNENMKKIITYDTTTNIQKYIPEWERPSKLFEYIRFYFNDQMIEELNEYVAGIKYYLNLSQEKRNQIDKMTKVYFRNGVGWQIYLPLLFWFSNNSSLSLPTIALKNTELRLSWKTKNIYDCLTNDLDDYKFSSTPNIKITLIDDFILLDMKERELFGTYSHEYIINKFNTYDSVYIDKTTSTIPKQIFGLIKDIYFITKPVNSKLTYYENIETDYDIRYQRYVDSLEYYNLFISNNKVYTSSEQRDYSLDIDLLNVIMIEYDNYINSIVSDRIDRLINNFSGYSIYNDELLKMLMYIEDKYFSNQTDNKKTFSLTMYLEYLYKPNKIIEKISPLDSLTIKTNGTELFAPRDWKYFNSVVPNQKFNNSLEIGFYVYSFSLYPNEYQHSGHLNFTHFDDVTFKISSNENVLNEPYNLHILTKEYNILRIMSGMGSLAWL